MSKLAAIENELELIELPEGMDEEAFIDYARYYPTEFGYVYTSAGVLVHVTDAEKARVIANAFRAENA